ncbi:MAG: sortase [Clostridiales bacterium]|nr:sortase [Clostridiales bacterium]
MRKKLSTLCMALGLVLLLAALALLIYNRWDDYRAGTSANQVEAALEEVIQANVEAAEAAAEDASEAEAEPEAEAVSDAEPEAEGSPEAEASDPQPETVALDGNEYIGILTVPALGLELPVMAEWSYAGLKIAPGRYSGSAEAGNLIICGHNYARHFGNLKYLEPGDTLSFTDLSGTVFQYAVEEVVILQPTDVDEMISQQSGAWDLTLFTCTVGGQTRVTVRCSRTG